MTELQRVFLIHGWTGHANKDWFPWVKEELTKKGYEVIVPEMPDSDNPIRGEWIAKMHQLIDPPKHNDILVGHSLGGLAVLRYLETLKEGQKIDKVVLVAPAILLSPAAIENVNDEKIVHDWKDDPINFNDIKSKAGSFTVLLSKNDPMVLYDENKKVIEENLTNNIVTFDKMGHFTQEDGVTEFSQLLDLI